MHVEIFILRWSKWWVVISGPFSDQNKGTTPLWILDIPSLGVLLWSICWMTQKAANFEWTLPLPCKLLCHLGQWCLKYQCWWGMLFGTLAGTNRWITAQGLRILELKLLPSSANNWSWWGSSEWRREVRSNSLPRNWTWVTWIKSRSPSQLTSKG